MCRVLNNFGELAVRCLERHLHLAERLATVQQTLPASLRHLVHAAHTGSDICQGRNGATPAVRGIKEGLWPIADEDTAQAAAAEAAPIGAGTGLASQPSVAASLPGATGGRNVSMDSQKGSMSTGAGLTPGDLMLASVFARQIRSLGAVQDACCLVVDTGAPGWPVLYADETWKLWSGTRRLTCSNGANSLHSDFTAGQGGGASASCTLTGVTRGVQDQHVLNTACVGVSCAQASPVLCCWDTSS